MLAISVWVGRENIARDVTLKIGKRNIYFNEKHIERCTNEVSIFTRLSELKELEYEELRFVEVNKIIFRNCKYIEIKDGYVHFLTKKFKLLAYVRIEAIDKLTLTTGDGIMFHV